MAEAIEEKVPPLYLLYERIIYMRDIRNLSE